MVSAPLDVGENGVVVVVGVLEGEVMSPPVISISSSSSSRLLSLFFKRLYIVVVCDMMDCLLLFFCSDPAFFLSMKLSSIVVGWRCTVDALRWWLKSHTKKTGEGYAVHSVMIRENSGRTFGSLCFSHNITKQNSTKCACWSSFYSLLLSFCVMSILSLLHLVGKSPILALLHSTY